MIRTAINIIVTSTGKDLVVAAVAQNHITWTIRTINLFTRLINKGGQHLIIPGRSINR